MENNGLATSPALAQNRLEARYEKRHKARKHNGFDRRLDLVGWLCIANESRGPRTNRAGAGKTLAERGRWPTANLLRPGAIRHRRKHGGAAVER